MVYSRRTVYNIKSVSVYKLLSYQGFNKIDNSAWFLDKLWEALFNQDSE